jgi:tetratricopeptide (TPR) repeat protein
MPMNNNTFDVQDRFRTLGHTSIVIILLCLIAGSLSNLTAQVPHPGPSNVVSKYMGALQRRDFKTIIDLTYSYQADVARIKAANPQVLWPKLIAEYNDKKLASFSQQQGYWQNYTEALQGMTGDPTQQIRAAIALLPQGCRWKVMETRIDHVQGSSPSASYDRATVYVQLDYPAPKEARGQPVIANRILKGTILSLTVHSKSQLVFGIAKIDKADTFWTESPAFPALSYDEAAKLVRTRMSFPILSIQQTVNQQIELGQNLGGGLSNWADFSDRAKRLEALLRRMGFSFKEPFQLSAGYWHTEATARPPDAWQPYTVSTNPSQYLGGVGSITYALNMSSDVRIVNIQQDGRTAVSKIRKSYLGCSPVCLTLRNSASELRELGDWARAAFPSIDVSPALQGGDSWSEDAEAQFVWDPQKGWNTTRIQSSGSFVAQTQEVSRESVSSGPAVNRPQLTAVGTTPQPTRTPSSAPPPTSTVNGSCPDYNSCLKNGNDALRVAKWNDAIANFQQASALEPSKQAPLALLAMANLSAGQDREVASAWDKILQIGQSIGLGVCRERALRCDDGNLFLSSAQVSFRDAKNQTVFAVPPSEVTSLGARQHLGGTGPYFSLSVGGKTYNFYFFPLGIECDTQHIVVQCPDAGIRQQIVVDNYVAQTIPKLPSMKTPQPAAVSTAPQPTGTTTPAPSHPTAVGICSEYVSCLKAGEAAVRTTDWGQALAYFQKASLLEPTNPGAWTSRGTIYLATGRSEQASAMWDKALSLGGPLTFVVCHPRLGGSCQSDRSDRGDLSLGPKLVSFIPPTGKQLFAVSPAEVTSAEVSHRRVPLERNELQLKITGKNYTFDFVPLGIDCGKEESAYCEDDQAVAQQLAVFNYISQAIPKLASGTLKPQATKP